MNDFLVLLVLLILSGVFSGSETALVSLSLGRVVALRKEGRSGAQALHRLKVNPTRMLVTILIGNNLVNIAASAMATVLATEHLGRLGPGVAVGVLTLLILVFGEITPKSLATRYSERISLLIAPPLYGLMNVMSPLIWLFECLTDWVHQLTKVKGDPIVTESELISMMEHGEEEGTIEHEEREMIERVFRFTDLKVADVMTARSKVFCLDGGRTVGDALGEILEGPYTRIPLFEKSPDEIQHILYLRDVVETMAAQKLDQALSKIARKALFVPENKPVDELISILRLTKRHLAVVVDEHGTMQGIVTLEDLLEELVGEIYDESDIPPSSFQELPEGGIEIGADAELRDVERYFDIDLSGKPTDNISRWILAHTERIPAVDETLVIDGLSVSVSSASPRRIHEVKLRLPETEEEILDSNQG